LTLLSIPHPSGRIGPQSSMSFLTLKSCQLCFVPGETNFLQVFVFYAPPVCSRSIRSYLVSGTSQYSENELLCSMSILALYKSTYLLTYLSGASCKQVMWGAPAPFPPFPSPPLPFLSFPLSFSLLSPPFPSPPSRLFSSPPLRSIGPLIAVRGSLAPPAGLGGARPPNGIW